ncbi:MAG: hypothetical protein KatS3mg031_0658 [Chitinophagales bacterium]|nr:MAG: hypothetical protein KatS3mg031_0658 [Chitinophagales bacterium]
MKMFQPRPLPFTYQQWANQPFHQRIRMLCTAWTLQGYGAPATVYIFYLLKIILYVAGWIVFCSFSNHLGGIETIASWWFHPEALERFILWSILFEVTGLGSGSGPLTGKYFPPFGGLLYFARPGTIKLPLFPGIPWLGRDERGWLDVTLYLALLFFLLRALVSPVLSSQMVLPVIVLIPLLGVLDKTIYLAARSEHYLIALFCFLFPGEEIAALKWVWIAIWWGAASSKLTRHFPAVVCVMLSNHPLLRWEWFKKQLYIKYPDDLRPGKLAHFLAHLGTFLEYTFPILLLLGSGGPLTLAGLVLMSIFHLHITACVPMGVPLEWNVIMVYGAFVLFGYHAEASVFTLHSPLLIALLVVSLFIVPLVGNFYPKGVSFLLSMRYYAGNWAYSIWLFRGNSEEKLDKYIKKSTPTVMKQLSRFYDEATSQMLVSKVIAFRCMHLHGRLLQLLVPHAVDNIEHYAWRDGEIIAGIVLGWNFGDGHLHHSQLLRAIQKRCHFAAGELRCIQVESEPLWHGYMEWRIVDAHDGLIKQGRVSIKELLTLQPYGAAG